VKNNACDDSWGSITDDELEGEVNEPKQELISETK
jgi:hypothetical protein